MNVVKETLDNQLLITHQGGHLWLTLNRPQKANAMTVEMMQNASAAILAAQADESVKSIILSGAGEKIFCAGVDIHEKPEGLDATQQRTRRSQALAALQDAILDCSKPLIVVLNGSAIGAGAMMALMADACVSVVSASISLPEIDIGIASFSGIDILSEIGGRALALDLIQSGRKMPAQEASTRGLVHALAVREDLLQAASKMADLLGNKNSKAFSENKRWINASLKASLGTARLEHARHRASQS